MNLREIMAASALALLTSTVYAQSSNTDSSTLNQSGATMPAPAATTSTDPYVQKRMEDKAAKKKYQADKKAAKSEYKQEKKQSGAALKQNLASEPAKPGETGQPADYGQPAATGTSK